MFNMYIVMNVKNIFIEYILKIQKSRILQKLIKTII